MVQLRKNYLYPIWLILIIALFFTNWVGLRERYVTSSIETTDVQGVGVGNVDVYKPGLEIVYLTPAGVYVVGGLSTSPWENTTYRNPVWDTDPLVSVSVGDFDSDHKGEEIAVLSYNGTLRLISRGIDTWENKIIGVLPWTPPELTIKAMISGQLIEASEAYEIVIIGEHYNWSSATHTSRVVIVEQFNNVTWSLTNIYTITNTLLCGAIGDVDPGFMGQELLVAGYHTGIIQLSYENGSWDTSLLFFWEDTIRSLEIGDAMADRPGYEIAFVKGNELWILSYSTSGWDPDTIWASSAMKAGISQTLVEDFDPYSPGHEVLGVGTVFENDRPILTIQSWNTIYWDTRILWNLIYQPEVVVTANFDFTREGSEVIVANHPLSVILAVPNISDRSVRAGQTVLLPALVLIPATVLTFGLADYISRVSERRRRNQVLEMVTKGFVKCPSCKRFVPKDKIEAHRRWHRTQQFR
ncbi:MAG: hypothetical protein ACFE89_04675 [Candidatus Hodarchaeota archaeon]